MWKKIQKIQLGIFDVSSSSSPPRLDSSLITHHRPSSFPRLTSLHLIALSVHSLPSFLVSTSQILEMLRESESMASVFLYHVVGDLTVGKLEMVEFYDSKKVESAIRAIEESIECGIPVWRMRSPPSLPGFVENCETRKHRFVGILNSLDIVAFLAKTECL